MTTLSFENILRLKIPFLCEENFRGRCETLDSAGLRCTSCWGSQTWVERKFIEGFCQKQPGVFVHNLQLVISQLVPNVLCYLRDHLPLVLLHRLVPEEEHVGMVATLPAGVEHLKVPAQNCQAWLVNFLCIPCNFLNYRLQFTKQSTENLSNGMSIKSWCFISFSW